MLPLKENPMMKIVEKAEAFFGWKRCMDLLVSIVSLPFLFPIIILIGFVDQTN